jgi:tetratricopeptide (TPR) repeat protein
MCNAKAQTTTQAGTRDSIAILAIKCLDSTSGSYNPHRAMNLFKLSAARGNSSSMNMVGTLYKLGIGEATNKVLAMQWYRKAAKAGFADAYYNIGMMHKDSLQFPEAFACFKKAMAFNSNEGAYAYGYMLYKGLGGKQSYDMALNAFRKGLSKNRVDCMYFLGLCMRNGYGMNVNKDSAKYWLTKAAQTGYRYAIYELNMPDPENAELITGVTATKIKKVKEEVEKHKKLKNKVRINKTLSPNEIEGIYSGFLVKYDWSGQKVVNSYKLNVNLVYSNGVFTGNWIEDDSISTPIKATLTNNGLSFSNMKYKKNEHFSSIKKRELKFEDAWLQMLKSKDSVFISGTLRQFISDEKEKERPITILLSRKKGQGNSTSKENLNANSEQGNIVSGNSFKVYPNPSEKGFTLSFSIKKSCEIYYTILTFDGRLIYTSETKFLRIGGYNMPLPINLAKGAYLIKLNCGGEIKTTKIVKL